MSLLSRRPRPDDRASEVLGLAGPSEAHGWMRRPILARRADCALAVHLDRELSDIGTALHDIGRSDVTQGIDHVAVAPSGVWLINVRQVDGRIERRDLGTRRDPQTQLHVARVHVQGGEDVGDFDVVEITANLERATRTVAALVPDDVPVHRALCFIDAHWPISARPFDVDGVWITWPKALTDKIQSSGLMPIGQAHRIAALIAGTALDGAAYVDA